MKASHLRGDLAKASGDAFCNLLQSYLDASLPNTASTRRLGDLDRQGMDIIQFDDSSHAVKRAIQCKGYERPFHSNEVPKLREEVRKFGRLGPVVSEYWLVLNRPITSSADRKQIEKELESLALTGRAKHTKLLDLEGVLNVIGDMAVDRIALWSQESQARLQSDYRQRLEVVSYIHDVPFEIETRRTDPSRFLAESMCAYFDGITSDTAGKNRRPPRYLLTGEFGFGKTSTLHALAAEWLKRGKRVIYTPAALLDENAFTNAAGLATELLRLIHPEESEFSDTELKLFKTLLKKDVARSSDWLLIIDGLDESPYWERSGHLAALWGSLSDLGIPFVTSMRDELYELRRADFEGRGIRYRGEFLKAAKLVEWPDHLIAVFLERFAAAREAPVPAAFRRLVELVRSGNYERHYGDIPKRPLFLGMLAEDAWMGEDPEKQLHRLYGKYLRRKIEGDRWSGGAGGKAVRLGAFGERFGFDESTERMIRTMQAIAGALLMEPVEIDSGQRNSVFGERLLVRCMEAEGGAGTRAEEVVLNSLIQPAGRDGRTRERLFRFAHKSFQEWFTARFLVDHEMPLEEITKGDGAVWKFASGMINDVRTGAALL